MDTPAATPAVSASVVVVTWNGSHLLRPCLDTLLAQVAPGIELEVIVVDNGSTDDTLSILTEEYQGVRCVALPENLGFAGGANAGIRASTADVVLLVNNDAEADPGFVAAATRALMADPGAAAVTGLILLADRYSPASDGTLAAVDGERWSPDPDGVVLVNSTGNITSSNGNGVDRDWLVPLDRLDRASGPADGFSGGAVALRRAAVVEVGLFDERYFMYYEDTDLSWRLRAAGWRILFERTAVVRHRHAASSGTGSEFFLFHNERNRLLFALRNAPAGVVARALARTLGSLAAAALRGRFAVARRKARALGSALRLAPAFLRDRRSASRRKDAAS